MSTPADLRSQVNGISYLAMASYSIFYYDFVLTFGEEVEYFWRPKLGVVSLFFLVNRYLSFFGIIPLYLGEFRDWSIESCRAFETFNSFFAVAVQIVVGALMVMRTYALYDRSGKILLFLCAVVIIGITLACWSILSGETSPDSSIKTPAAPGCITALTDDEYGKYPVIQPISLMTLELLQCSPIGIGMGLPCRFRHPDLLFDIA
ncbi:hypothetical protein BD410DRAFT_786014 [Rickenella mellea]|uniref:DUF6533 domain-containing protein n=1 Tax=Rickenella mellea TaxID=50990 RepID=A0A4Y7QCE4_9AGAM|nr:hypothetical protein BD410DRAFT_786014 [Rickenella mellea]